MLEPNSSLRRSIVMLAAASALIALPLAGCGDKAGDAGKADGAKDSAGASAGKAQEEFTTGERVEDPDQRYTLNLRPSVGDVFSYKITQQGTQEFGALKSSEQVVYNFTGKITGVNTDGSVTLEMRYDSVRIRRTAPAPKTPTDTATQTISFDSRRRADSTIPGSEQFRAIIGQKVNITLAKDGEVREVSNLEPIISAMLSLLGKQRDSVPPQGIEALREALKVQAFGSVLQQMFLQSLPDSSIAAGGTWNRKDSLPVGGVPARSNVTYRLADVRRVDDRPIGQLEMKLVVDFPKKTIDNPQMSATITSAEVGGKGDALIDLTSGFPVRKHSQIDMNLKMTGKLKVGPEAGKSQSIAQRVATVTTVERTHFVPATSGK